MLRTVVLLACVLFSSCLQDRTAVSKEEALAAAKKLETIIKNKDVEAYAAFFDEDYLLKILEEKSKALDDPGIMKGFKSTFSLKSIAQTVITGTQEGGGYHFLRSYEKDGRQHILFRVLSDKGLNYLDFHLLKLKNKVKAVDFLSYLTGEDVTTTLADAIDVVVPENADITNATPIIDSMGVIKKLKEKGDYQGVKEAYERLPVTLQETKGILMMYVFACKYISDSSYAMSLEKLAKLFPVTPSSYLMMIDAYAQAKDYDKALMAVDKVDEFTGGDPFLDYYRGNVYWLKGEKDKSIALFEKVYAYDPNQFLSLDALIAVYMDTNEIEKAKKIAAAYKTSKNFSQQYMDLLNANYPALLH